MNEVEETKKAPGILSLMSATTYKLLKNLSTLKVPDKIKYEDILELLKEHLNSKQLKMTERFRFYKHIQLESDCISTYWAELQKLSMNCNFGENLNSMLKDKLVMGLRNESIAKKLLSVDNFTYAKAKEIAFAVESAQHDVWEIQSKILWVNKLFSS